MTTQVSPADRLAVPERHTEVVVDCQDVPTGSPDVVAARRGVSERHTEVVVDRRDLPTGSPEAVVARGAVPSRPTEAVRVLHTSDWHLGVAVRNVPRDVDHEAVIKELTGIAIEATPDVIVHTGDLFHGGRPGMADFARAIRALRELAEVAPVVVLAGNHDSSVALETLGVALQDPVPALAEAGSYQPDALCPARIRVMHRPAPAAKGGVMTFATAAGGRLRLVGLPFLHVNRVLDDFADIQQSHAKYADTIAAISDRLGRAAFDGFSPARDVAVFASHLHVAGARTSTEKEIHVSSEYATDPAHLEGRYGYLAFGHIHIAQPVAGGRGRYAGSILEVDFGEEGEAKQLVVADLIPGRRTEIHDIVLTAARRLHRIKAPYSQLAAYVEQVGNGLVEVTVQLEPNSLPAAGHASDGASHVADAVGDVRDAAGTASDFAVHAPDGTVRVSDVAVHAPDGTVRVSDAVVHVPDIAGHVPDSEEGVEDSVGDGSGRVSLDIVGFDTLTDAVHAVFSDATVVGVIDARRPDVAVADEIDLPEMTESPGELFRSWFAEHGRNLIAKTNAHNADPERICSLFDEMHSAITTDADVRLPEASVINMLLKQAERL